MIIISVKTFSGYVTKIISIFEILGLKVMDFGFSSFLEKFERFYGARATKVLVGLVGAAVVSTSIGLTWNWIFNPIWHFFETAPKLSNPWETFKKILSYAVILMMLVSFLYSWLSLKWMNSQDLDYARDVERIYEILVEIADQGATKENLKKLQEIKQATNHKKQNLKSLFQSRR